MSRPVALIAAAALAAVALAGCGGGSAAPRLTAAEQRQLDVFAIDRIERKWHDAETHRDLREMMSLWASHAIWQIDVNVTLVGKSQIRGFWMRQVFPVARKQHWFSETPSFRLRTTVDGDRGTLYFECHEVDSRTHKLLLVVGQDLDVKKVGGRWLITKSSGSSPTLTGGGKA